MSRVPIFEDPYSACGHVMNYITSVPLICGLEKVPLPRHTEGRSTASLLPVAHERPHLNGRGEGRSVGGTSISAPPEFLKITNSGYSSGESREHHSFITR